MPIVALYKLVSKTQKLALISQEAVVDWRRGADAVRTLRWGGNSHFDKQVFCKAASSLLAFCVLNSQFCRDQFTDEM